MCFNSTTSLITFSISLFCFMYLVYYGIKYNNKEDIFAGIVTILIGNMQLLEYFLWDNQTCGSMNHFLSLLILVTLVSQVIIGSFSYIWLFGSKYATHIFWIIFLYILFTMYQLNWLNQHKLCSKPSDKSCRLVWAPYSLMAHDNYGILLFGIHLFFYFFLFLYSCGVFDRKLMNFVKEYPVRYTILPITLSIALIYSYIKEENYIDSSDTFGSTWCFMAVAFGIVSIFHI